MDAGMAAGRVSALADHEGAELGAGALSQDRLSECLLLRSAQEHAPKSKSLDEVDPKLLETYKKLGIPLHEQMALAGVAVDAVFDSVSVATTFKEKLNEAGVIFCPISEAIRDYPELVKKYLGTVVPVTDNFFATLNSAVFSDGTFVYVPKGVRCPMELSTYFRINASETGQFERTIIIADEGSYVSYLEGCTAPKRDENQLTCRGGRTGGAGQCRDQIFHGAELVSGRRKRPGWHLQFRHQARRLPWQEVQDQLDTGGNRFGHHLEISQLYPARRRERGRILLHRHRQQLPAGRYRHQDDPSGCEHPKSRIISKGISAGKAQNTYRGLVSVYGKAKNARNYTQCDSLLIGGDCGAHTVPYIESRNPTARIEHEATTSKIAEDQLFYCLAARHSAG
jgi:Fe-S cluster assembly protein SufB